VAKAYTRHPFEKLLVQWYGGDPSLALDTVEDISRHLIDWCARQGAAYEAMMLTNCNLIDEKAVDLLVRCRVSSVLITIDGPEEIHNRRRVAADGSNSYERNIQAVRLFSAAGIAVHAIMNADKVSWPHYRATREKLLAELGLDLAAAKLNDYGHFFGTREFRKPDFDLFTHEEFAHENHRVFAESGFDSMRLREMFRPVCRFCRGQLDDYYVIDTVGDVYACDGYMGVKGHVRFNILDDESEWELETVTFDATADERCGSCELLPICQGNCIWERRETGMPCHPLKYAGADYLRDYRSCFGAAQGPFTLLAPPMEVAR